jgi:hypothetical protein
MVWRFFFGINSNVVFNGDRISFIQQTLKCVAGDKNNLYSNCLSPYNHLSVCHCAFEAHNDLIDKEVTLCLITYPFIDFGFPLTAHDCSAILYVIANLQECGCDLKVDFGNASENQVKELMHILTSKNGKLWISSLDLSGSRLTVSSLQALESAVRGDVLAELENLYLEGSLTSDADTNAKWLATLSGHCPNLENLCLSNNNLGVSGASAVAKLHVSNWLYLNNANLGDKGLTVLVESLKVISYLELTDNDIHASGVSCLADAVCSEQLKFGSNILNLLDLSGNPLGLEGTIAVGRMLSSSHCKLDYVRLSGCDLTTAGGGLPSTDSMSCEAVGQQLCQMPQTSTISQLNLDHNSLTGDGIHILASFMHLCPGLKYLFTRDCGITSDDLIWLLGKLKSSSPDLCSKLEYWHLTGNQIDNSGVSALIDHLPRLGCGDFTFGINSLSNNPVMDNSEVMERMKEEVTRRRREEEEERTRFLREREKSHEEEEHKEVS